MGLLKEQVGINVNVAHDGRDAEPADGAGWEACINR